jgi:NAD(P)-dependent dehydrogenase (short-subunit alcohol dehydrogenase family)
MTGRLNGKTAIVTGAGRGIGRGIARAYGREGAKVIVASRTQKTVDSVTAEIIEAGGTAIGITLDVGDRAQINAMVAKTRDTFGPVDVLVNTAQSIGKPDLKAILPPNTPIENIEDAEWDYTFRTGVKATLYGMQAVFPDMKKRGGKIINFGSSWGQTGNLYTAAYNSDKEAIRGLSRTAAREWGKYGITVNVINPALRTRVMDAFLAERGVLGNEAAIADLAASMTPLGRFGDVDRDGGPMAVFLASPESDYLTGETFNLDGGMFLHP